MTPQHNAHYARYLAAATACYARYRECSARGWHDTAALFLAQGEAAERRAEAYHARNFPNQ